MKIAKLKGALAEANRKLEEAGMEDADANARQHRELLPFEQKVIDFVNEPAGRTILWIYSMIGDLGKSRCCAMLVEMFDALVIDPAAAKDALKLIGKHKAKSALFKSKPVLILDLPRNQPVTAKKLYQVLEVIQGSFSDRNGTIQWAKLPHVIVFANDTPETERLSADRLRVYLLTKEHELVLNLFIEKQLKEVEGHQRLLQEQEEEAARTGKPPPRELNRRARGVSGAGNSSSADGSHVTALRARTLIQSLTLPLL